MLRSGNPRTIWQVPLDGGQPRERIEAPGASARGLQSAGGHLYGIGGGRLRTYTKATGSRRDVLDAATNEPLAVGVIQDRATDGVLASQQLV